MAQITPRKTSMRLKRLPKQLRPSLKFAEQNAVTIADRDYGLMRVTAASGTPHPRVITGLNLATLKERLEEEQEKKIKAQLVASEVEIPFPPGIHFDSDGEKNHKKIRLTDTPHPLKGTVLNPKKAPDFQRPSKANWSRKSSDPGDIQSLLQRYGSRSSSGPKRKTIMKKMKDTRSLSSKKSVTLIMPEVFARATIEKGIGEKLSSSFSSEDSSTLLSFNERRRIFHEGEFTIAKYGRKMSDHLMPVAIKSFSLGDNIDTIIDGEAERAKAEIDLYIRNQGFIMAPTGTLTNLRRFSSQMSKRSVQSKAASMESSQSSFDSFRKRSSSYFASEPN